MYLSEAREGEKVRIVDIETGGRGRGHGGGYRGKGVVARLTGMGLRIGQVAEIVRNAGSGPIIVRVGETSIAIGRGIASKIVVEPI
ncbi:MAG: FeoA family protein [Thermosulfidibacteraceae bacterium]|jgi:ferrous iron transport protein A